MKKMIFAMFVVLLAATTAYAETRSSEARAMSKDESCNFAKNRARRALDFVTPKLKIVEYKECECTETEDENAPWLCKVSFDVEPVEE